MSTNYDLTLHRPDGRYEWSRRIHLAHETGNGFLLQAVVGEDGWPDQAGVDLRGSSLASVLVYTGGVVPTTWTWAGWKRVLTSDPGFVVLVEDREPITPAEFIRCVQAQSEPSLRHERHEAFIAQPDNAWMTKYHSGHYLDPEGYSFCWRQVS